MNPVQKLEKVIRKSFPAASCALDAPEKLAGSWFLDIRLADYWLNVEWQQKRGFGLTARNDVVYGEGADEAYPDFGPAVRRVLGLLEHKAATSPRLADQLRKIRLKRSLTQEELAKRLGIKQSSVSRLEGRGENIGLRKLQELIAAMGGQLSVHVVYPEGGEADELSLGDLRTGTYA
jgi:DNA-binding Xre family transcriptional regulator